MQIIFYAPGSDSDAWLNAFRAALPNAQIRIWHEDDQEPADYAITWRPPLALLQKPGLKAVFNLGAGVDAILEYGAALPPDLPIVRLEDAGMGLQMAEYVLHAVLRYFRRFDEYGAQAKRAEWQRLAPHAKSDFGIGLLGLGVLAQPVINTLKSFGFPLYGWSRTLKSIQGITCFTGIQGLTACLAASRVIVCMLPLTAHTQHVLNRSNLEKMMPGSYIINVGRGAHLNEMDLIELINNGHIKAATLDVFQGEPLKENHPFWQLPGITITPHCAALTLIPESVNQIIEKIQFIHNNNLAGDA